MFNIFKKKKSHAEEVQEELLRELEEEAKEKENSNYYTNSIAENKDVVSDFNYSSDSSNINTNFDNQIDVYSDESFSTNAENDSVNITNDTKTNSEYNSVAFNDGVSNDNVCEEKSSDSTKFQSSLPSDDVNVQFSVTAANADSNEVLTSNIVDNENADTENSADSEIEEIHSQTKKGFFAKLKEGLTKTRNNIVSGMDSLFSSDDKIDDDFYDELEEILILGDIGVHTTDNILEKLKTEVKHNHIKKRTDCKEFLIKSIKEAMAIGETAYDFENKKSIVFVIGVNGVGKTTSIGKLAALLKASGKRVMLGACDTFRAAAGSQLEEWSHRAGVEMIGGKEGQDPSSVLFDAVTAAKARNVDVLLVDTAGRLHNKKNLMEELKKMNRVIDKVYPEVHRENLIVLDASTGQNALNQAKEFGEVADLTGIILTKMDGTAKGGIAIAITSELQVPVKYIGVGERIVDLQKFNPDSFVDALFDVEITDDKIIEMYNNAENAENAENFENAD